ncbi:TlpA family protein disulfide reductase [Dactylosporangium matsuzakiense]|uniref:Thioredoxin domain-containing protein n=1 Tax=Dactylosporangium matsuzakiense TaxID=53360 RepID=A0A9W6NPS6_9ACTN|nr:TlpA disulfide reductase family protein [Dactylosporangium matsuzakiense]UWZ45475.1 TlpA family protein disulfide reductase [Dactylosporangium matsuzakiense]GLL04377.1 hypothetical protein GCM10017581_061240 [Dactylosporangium matsuzakiense]
MRLLPLLLAIGLLAGCTADVQPSASQATAPAGPRCIEKASSPAPASAAPGPALPAMALPCFDGGRFIDVADLGGQPTVVNLWASWCRECRDELPAVQRFAAAGKVRVVGIATKDRHDQAKSVIDEFGLTFANLEDQGQQFVIAASSLTSKSLVALPATLFVTPGGRIAYAYQGPALTVERLQELSAQYLGVS